MQKKILEKLEKIQQKMREDDVNIFFSRKNENVENTDLLDLIGFKGSTGDLLINQDEVFFIHDSRYSAFAEELKKKFGEKIKIYCVNDFFGKKNNKGEKVSPHELIFEVIFSDLGFLKKLENKLKINISGNILNKDFEDIKNVFKKVLINKKLEIKNIKSISSRKIENFIYAEKKLSEPKTLKNIQETKLKNLRKKMKKEGVDVLVLNQNKKVISSCVPYFLGMNIEDGNYFVTQNVFKKLPDVILRHEESFLLEEFLDQDFSLCENDIKIFIVGKILQEDFEKLSDVIVRHEESFSKKYSEKNKKIEIIKTNNFISELQEIKFPEEIEIMREAQHHVDKILLEKFPEMLRLGMTEKELAEKLEKSLKADRKFGLSFDSIVAFGENSASPHSNPGNRKLKFNENILIDCGITLHGYCSDLTRNFWFGNNVDEHYAKDYEDLKILQKEFFKFYKSGENIKKLSEFSSGKLMDRFGQDGLRHSLGHSLGIVEVHQFPAVYSRIDENIFFEKGIIMTNEPGVYREGKYGIRIEDSVVIGDDGGDILTGLNHELVIINPKDSCVLIKRVKKV